MVSVSVKYYYFLHQMLFLINVLLKIYKKNHDFLVYGLIFIKFDKNHARYSHNLLLLVF